jgi:DNA-binding XRE family transcriptional regulator
MRNAQLIHISGTRLVVMEEREYERLCRAAGHGAEESLLPPFPDPDNHGNVPALEYSRASIARQIVRERRAAGLSQQALADLAGLRQETLSRIETGKHTASLPTIDKIDRALKKAAKTRGAKARKPAA